jgi:hypothetical protein
MSGLGLLAGLLLGALTAAGFEIIGDRVHTERQIKKLVPFEVLAEIPTLQTPAEHSAARRSALLTGAVAAAIVLCILAGSAITYLRG